MTTRKAGTQPALTWRVNWQALREDRDYVHAIDTWLSLHGIDGWKVLDVTIATDGLGPHLHAATRDGILTTPLLADPPGYPPAG